MANDLVAFDQASARRISEVVRAMERRAKNNVQHWRRRLVAGFGNRNDFWAVVVDKFSYFGATDVRAKYTCEEIEWLEDGTWQVKAGGRTFTNCWESSTGSNANIHHTRMNIVHLFRVQTVAASSSSSSSGAGDEAESSSSSSDNTGIDDALYVFDKCLGNIFRPARV